MKRVRAAVTLDLDEVSPDRIDLANQFLTENLNALAERAFQLVDWGTFRTYVKVSKRKQTFKIVAFARTVK